MSVEMFPKGFTSVTTLLLMRKPFLHYIPELSVWQQWIEHNDQESILDGYNDPRK